LRGLVTTRRILGAIVRVNPLDFKQVSNLSPMTFARDCRRLQRSTISSVTRP